MEILVSSANCEEAFSPSEGHWVMGGNLAMEPDVDPETIRFSEEAWNDEKMYFMEKIQEAIQAHEKRYKTNIVKISLTGKLGLWNGNPVAGNLFNPNENPLEKMGNVDEISVERAEDGTITILGHHHDGTHRMHVYLLSEKRLDAINPNWNSSYGGLDADDFEKIYASGSPLKMKSY
ncbi:hypothetical protein JMA_39480 (plasmid) [Jeotgalibacillus malaysiensis]|uniref:Uncharacterized protein n=1 Tax=Jeotgalibacillus malaysiensis TaxID=1508404 RepID=A0A0B5AT10_9BACL|nr:hypothetical protein [Jeotgalibacillus malaysiensis]AJD93266.1 hypothetical protein JMA_39480 [Jeotgalibacillus malaysiensis]